MDDTRIHSPLSQVIPNIEEYLEVNLQNMRTPVKAEANESG